VLLAHARREHLERGVALAQLVGVRARVRVRLRVRDKVRVRLRLRLRVVGEQDLLSARVRGGAQHQMVRQVAQQHLVLAQPAHRLLVAVRTLLVRAIEPQPRQRAHTLIALLPVAATASVVVVAVAVVAVAVIAVRLRAVIRPALLAALLATLLVALRQALQSLARVARLAVTLLEPRERGRRAGALPPLPRTPRRADGLLVLLLALLQQRLGLRGEILPGAGWGQAQAPCRGAQRGAHAPPPHTAPRPYTAPQ